MANNQIKCWHINHSSTAVYHRNTGILLVFDYYQHPKDSRSPDFPDCWQELPGLKKAFFFVTHSHQDHFSTIIFDWRDEFPETTYILSSDVKTSRVRRKLSDEDYYFVASEKKLNLKSIYLETYETTDQGVSYYVKDENLNLFHAGDLNWWDWSDFSPEERSREEKEYKEVVSQVKNHKLQLAFVPVDPRLGESFHLAGQYFISELKPEVFVPLHFRDDYQIITRFKEKITEDTSWIPELKHQGDSFDYKF